MANPQKLTGQLPAVISGEKAKMRYGCKQRERRGEGWHLRLPFALHSWAVAHVCPHWHKCAWTDRLTQKVFIEREREGERERMSSMPTMF